MLSRVADNLYWMSRYLERAEHTARLVGVHLGLMLEAHAGHDEKRWPFIIHSLGITSKAPGGGDPAAILNWLTFDPAGRSSIVAAVSNARENARQVREMISSEMWEQVNRLFHEVRGFSRGSVLDRDPQDFLQSTINGCHLFDGITASTMNHGEGWQFIRLGRFIERAGAVSTLLDVHFEEFLPSPAAGIDPADHLEWIGLLKVCTAFEAYCKVYTAELRADRIADFLLLNREFPHSVRFAVDAIQTALHALPAGSSEFGSSRLTRLAGRLQASLNFSQMDEIMAGGLSPALAAVHKQCTQIHNVLHQVYIDYPIETALEA